MQFGLLEGEMNGTCDKFHPPHLFNVATLPYEIQNTKNAREHKFIL